MPLKRWIGGLLGALVAVAIAAAPAHALRIVTWNVAKYTGASTNEPALRTVVAGLDADVFILQELNSAAGRDSFLISVLGNVNPGEWAGSAWFQLDDVPLEGGALFYKPAKIELGGMSAIGINGPRKVMVAFIKPVGYEALGGIIRLYSMHLKAGGPNTEDSTTRRNEGAALRTSLNGLPPGTNILLGGDSNFYSAAEGGYIRLTEHQLDNDGRLKDPLNIASPGTWHDNASYAVNHTQSPCTSCPPGSGFSNGGMDDRFDIWLHSYNMADGEGIDYVPQVSMSSGAYPFSYGNDGQHFNVAINAGGVNNAVGITIANALHDASDHLPQVIVLQIAPRIAAASELNFGPVIVGATANLNLAVSDAAATPADELNYSFTAPAGFTAPGGSFIANAGSPANNHSVGMSTATPGDMTGTLIVNTDDPDSTAKETYLSGTVLRHAVASLDSSAISTSTLVDFGDYAIGYFSDQMLRVHNQGYDALQAKLSHTAANITGGDGRFSIVGGFSPTLVGSPAKTWNIHFNDVGATLDAVYTATLTFTNADEPLPGAAAAAGLTITLRAKPVSTTTGVPNLPKVLAFYPPHPNPLHHETLFAFDLPAAAPVSLAIYDLSGRRVASLVAGTQEADRHQVHWDGKAEGGQPVPAGLYFARFSTPGLTRLTRLIVLP